MLVLGSRFKNTPIMGIQTGAQLAQTSRALVDPRNLTIVAYEVEGPLLVEHPSFLRTNEIREIGPIGMIIDSNEEIIGLDDVISLKKLYDLEFELIGLNVVDENRHKLGKVQDYTLESHSFVIQQLHVKRGMLSGLNDTGLLIGRSQIVEITDTEVVVKATNKKERAAEPVMEASRHEYINPFRQPNTQPETIKAR